MLHPLKVQSFPKKFPDNIKRKDERLETTSCSDLRTEILASVIVGWGESDGGEMVFEKDWHRFWPGVLKWVVTLGKVETIGAGFWR